MSCPSCDDPHAMGICYSCLSTEVPDLTPEDENIAFNEYLDNIDSNYHWWCNDFSGALITLENMIPKHIDVIRGDHINSIELTKSQLALLFKAAFDRWIRYRGEEMRAVFKDVSK